MWDMILNTKYVGMVLGTMARGALSESRNYGMMMPLKDS